MMAARAVLVMIGATGFSLRAQTAPEFEVASVKVSPERSGTARYTSMDADPAMVRYVNITLRNLIAIAYRYDSALVSGPDWIDSQPYDVAAKLPSGTPKERVPAMLQTLLAERFKLAIHRESKEQRVYFLVAAKGGPKLKPARNPAGRIRSSAAASWGPRCRWACWRLCCRASRGIRLWITPG